MTNNIYIFEPLYDESGGCILVAAKSKRSAISIFKKHPNRHDFEFVSLLKGVKTKKDGFIYESYCIN